MRKGVVAIAGLLVLAGAAAAAVPALEDYAASRIKSEIERSGTAEVDAVEVGLLDRRITLTHFRTVDSGATLVARRWEASGLAWPLGELLRGRTPLAGGFRWGAPLQADRVELTDVHVVDGTNGSGLTAQSIVVDGLDLTRFDPTYDGRFPLQVRTARALAALALRRAEVRGLKMSLPGASETLGVAETILDNYEQGRVARLMMTGIEATAKNERKPLVTLAEVRATGLDGRRLLAALSSARWHSGAPSGRFHADSASISGFGGEMLRRYGISLGSITFETVHESDKISRSRTRIAGFVLAPPRGLHGLRPRIVLQSMGLEEVKLDLDCASSEDRAKGELAVGPCALTAPGLGEVDLAGRIVQADPAFWRIIDDGDMAALDESGAGLASARLVLADKSLLERGLKALAAATGQPVSATRSGLAREIRLYQPPDVLISEDMTRLLDTVARFVEQGGTLTIDARPDPPVGIDDLTFLLRPGADLVRRLGLSATLSQ